MISKTLEEPTGLQYQHRSNEIHSKKFAGDYAQIPSALRDNKSNENDERAIPCMSYKEKMIECISYAEIRERTDLEMYLAGVIPYSSSLPIPHEKDYFHHQFEAPDTNEEVAKGKRKQIKTPFVHKTTPSISHAAESVSKALMGEKQTIENPHTGRRNTSQISKFTGDTSHEIDDNNKSRDWKVRDYILSETTDSNNCSEKPNTCMITNALSQRSQLKVDNDSSLSITQDHTSLLKGNKYSSVLTDFPNTAAFNEQTLPRSRKSCEVLSSDGQIQNAKASRKQVPPTTVEYQHVRGIYKDDATISGLRTEDEDLKDLYVQKHCKEMIKSPNVLLANSKTTYANNTRRLKRVER